MTLCPHQPAYLPWLGLFHKVSLSDVFCVLDTAQYETGGVMNRNRIKTASGAAWLTVPVEGRNHLTKRICDIRIHGDAWREKHCRSLSHAYGRAPYYDCYAESIYGIINDRKTRSLSDLNVNLLRAVFGELGLDQPIVKASDYGVSGKGSERILNLARQLGASSVIFGAHGREYVNVRPFSEHAVGVFFQDYIHPTYRQLHGAFLPGMSVLDLLFNEGPKSLKILTSGNSRRLAAS